MEDHTIWTAPLWMRRTCAYLIVSASVYLILSSLGSVADLLYLALGAWGLQIAYSGLKQIRREQRRGNELYRVCGRKAPVL